MDDASYRPTVGHAGVMLAAAIARAGGPSHILALTALSIAVFAAPQPCDAQALTLTTRIAPSEFAGTGRLVVVAALDSEAPLPANVVLRPTITPERGFTVEPHEYPVRAGDRHAAATFVVRAADPTSGDPDGVVVMRVERGAEGGPHLLASSEAGFVFRPEISGCTYVFLVALGLVIGWALKRTIKYMAHVPDPADLPEEKLAEYRAARDRRTRADRWREFLARWFDLFDGLLTVLIGLAVAIGLMDAGATPPSIAATAPQALLFGIGIGSLGNTELLGRLRGRG